MFCIIIRNCRYLVKCVKRSLRISWSTPSRLVGQSATDDSGFKHFDVVDH